MNLNTATIKDFFGDYGFVSSIQFTAGQIIASLLLSFVFALFVFYVYQKTYQGVAYSRNFGVTLIIVSLISAVIVIAISGNLALSLGMIGALSIVRFRSAIKDPRDIAYLFWAVSNGIVCGVFIYKLAIVSNILIGGIIFFFYKKAIYTDSYLLIVRGKRLDREVLFKCVRAACSYVKSRYELTKHEHEEMHIEIRLAKDKKNGPGNLLHVIEQEVRGVEDVSAVSHEGVMNGI